MGDTPERTPDGQWADTPPPTPPSAGENPPTPPWPDTGWRTPTGSPDHTQPAASRKAVHFATSPTGEEPDPSPTTAVEDIESRDPPDDRGLQLASSKERCAICLSRFKRPAMLRPCLHIFCFECVMRWREMSKTRCPMCKTGFHSVITDIVSDSDYKVHTFDRKRPRATREPDSPVGAAVPGCEWRRQVYSRSQWAKVLSAPRRRYSSEIEEKSRVEPWVVRELQTVLKVEDVALISVLVLATINEPRGDFMVSQLRDFMESQDEVNHFVHELRCFVNSGMDMELYDNSVSYEHGPPGAEHALLAHNTAVCSAASQQVMLHTAPNIPFRPGAPEQTNENTAALTTAVCSAASQQMMANMGWQQGEGLGKLADGRAEAIQPVQRRKRAGLGLPFSTDAPKVNKKFLHNTLRQQGAQGMGKPTASRDVRSDPDKSRQDRGRSGGKHRK